jgi:proteic killer suppression protein
MCLWLTDMDRWTDDVLSITALCGAADSDTIIALELAFANKSLRQLCESKAKANRDFGVKMADGLRRRVADLRAATCVSDLVIGTPRELEGDRQEQIALDLDDGFRLIFCANHNAVPELESGGIDWSKVSRVKILCIESGNA